jgi:pyridoxamine 5'-phosphate oxidase
MTDPAAQGSVDDALVAIARRRTEYESAGLDVADVDPDPLRQWQRWYAQAVEAACVEPNAVALATVDGAGFPQVRYLLVRGVDDRGFTVFTNYRSAKSRHLAASPRVGGLFTWLQLHRQVRLVATASRLPEAESDAYFASRPRASQVGAWASPQSEVIADRAELEARVAAVDARFAGAEVPRPPHWGGWLLEPVELEFWQGRPSRLHDRVRYARAADGAWEIARLAP